MHTRLEGLCSHLCFYSILMIMPPGHLHCIPANFPPLCTRAWHHLGAHSFQINDFQRFSRQTSGLGWLPCTHSSPLWNTSRILSGDRKQISWWEFRVRERDVVASRIDLCKGNPILRVLGWFCWYPGKISLHPFSKFWAPVPQPLLGPSMTTFSIYRHFFLSLCVYARNSHTLQKYGSQTTTSSLHRPPYLRNHLYAGRPCVHQARQRTS